MELICAVVARRFKTLGYNRVSKDEGESKERKGKEENSKRRQELLVDICFEIPNVKIRTKKNELFISGMYFYYTERHFNSTIHCYAK